MSSMPRLLDLFCGAGGASVGYARAGFDVVGVDIEQQRHYPYEFYCGDALAFPLDGFDLVHASPPCQRYSVGTQYRRNAGVVYPDLLGPTQDRLRACGTPYVIENVPGARRLLRDPFMLCGGMFGLGVVRHRYFEASRPLLPPLHMCNRPIVDSDAVAVVGCGPPPRWYRRNPGATFSVKTWREAMGIDWMPKRRLTQAIPPAYTEWIGRQMLGSIAAQGAGRRRLDEGWRP